MIEWGLSRNRIIRSRRHTYNVILQHTNVCLFGAIFQHTLCVLKTHVFVPVNVQPLTGRVNALDFTEFLGHSQQVDRDVTLSIERSRKLPLLLV